MATKPPLNKEFSSAVNSLPSYSPSSAPYRHFLDTYGTHYITKVVLGGEIKAFTSVKTCQASMGGLTESEVKNCLSVEASANVQSKASVDAMIKHCREKTKKLGHDSSFSSTFSERFTEITGGVISSRGDILFTQSDPSVYNEWLDSLKRSPDVVQYNLSPLHTVLPDGHKAKFGIKKEIETYIKNNALAKKCSESCRIGHRSNPRDPCACVCNKIQNIRSNCCPSGKGLATLVVYKLYAKKLYGDKWTKTDGSVEVTYGDQVRRTDIINNDDNPRWKERFNFGPVTLNMKDKLQFKVYDADTYWNSDLLGECSFALHQGDVSDSCMFDYGTFFFSYSVQCAPSLGGDQCQEYMPTPMSASVANNFYTRNGVLWKDING